MTERPSTTADDEFESILAGYPDVFAAITTVSAFGAAVRDWCDRNNVPIKQAEKRLADMVDAHRAEATSPEGRVRAQADALGIRQNARARFIASRANTSEAEIA